MFGTISGTEGLLGAIAAVLAIIGALGYLLKLYIRQIISEIKPNGGNSDTAGDVLLRAGTAVGEIKATLDRHVENDNRIQQDLHDAVLVLTKRGFWRR